MAQTFSNQDFKEVLYSLKALKEQEKLNVDDNVLFDGAVRMYNSLLINKGQKSRAEKEEVPITLKQKQLLEKLNYKGSIDLSKRQAASLISELLERDKER